MLIKCLLVGALLVLFPAVSSAWVVACRITTTDARIATALGSAHGDDNDKDNAVSGNSNRNAPSPRHVHLVSWEGCLVDTVKWRTTQGLAICRHVWPDLEILLQNDDKQWLYNKVRALHHVLQIDDAQYSPAVEYALLIRLLLEEQELDEGRSNGSRGKYGSKFHPAAGAASMEEPSFNKRQQRPLTVGEIAANWQETLREAVFIRYYREEGKNPLDLLQKAVQEQYDNDKNVDNAPGLLDPDDVEVLRQRGGDYIVVVAPHESDLPALCTALQNVNHVVVCNSVEQALTLHDGDEDALPVLCRSKHLVRDVLQAMTTPGSSLSVFEYSWPTLQRHVPVFGDHVPRQPHRPQPCSVADRLLHLCLWRSSHPADQAAALMNAWTFCREQAAWPKVLQVPIVSSAQRR